MNNGEYSPPVQFHSMWATWLKKKHLLPVARRICIQASHGFQLWWSFTGEVAATTKPNTIWVVDPSNGLRTSTLISMRLTSCPYPHITSAGDNNLHAFACVWLYPYTEEMLSHMWLRKVVSRCQTTMYFFLKSGVHMYLFDRGQE